MAGAMTAATEQSNKPFGEALADLLRDSEYSTRLGNPNYNAFAHALHNVHYETLRKAIRGERAVSPQIMEECARVLSVRPQYFAEYRLWELRSMYDAREIGLEQALRNYKAWAATQQQRSKRGRR